MLGSMHIHTLDGANKKTICSGIKNISFHSAGSILWNQIERKKKINKNGSTVFVL